ncbi:Os05g0118900 [Oryza sativa Japonica Group]|uniref:Os05g0118900 protein n=2 Tax=Oryza sativa subsp. japonica TaxID=39947 RepID=A0A0P0WH91_ORYSJ|nr:unknow protein [Oryza sativa Japonica Group]KAB8097862.1 hypothetical protein EE612_026722 [Oryza sativa]BAF16394.1 Os05g0118900 [Oryza sativa Japonica Group]BAS91996.1 Os05g0118900 [Oryza sativa Japonica Group]|eukprot:NP_001054480.1 Os05g0118900 [Oryza sativa Japonica Group]
MLLTVEAPMSMFITTICSWMASSGDAPPMMRPVMAPGSAISPTVLALSITGDSAITSDLLTCRAVACRGVAPSASAVSTTPRCIPTSSLSFFIVTPVTVIAFPTIIPATGMMYRGVNGNTRSATRRAMVTEVPARMETAAMCFPRGTWRARCPAV